MALPLELRAGLGLAAVAAALFAWHRIAEGLREEGRQECRDAAAAEFKENADELSRIAARAQLERDRLAADGAGLRSAADRLRGAVAGSGLVIRPAAPGASAPAGDAAVLSAELLDRFEALARLADARGAAGATCEQSYDALRR